MSDRKAELLSRQRVFEGSFFGLDRDRLRLPNGAEAELEVVRHPGACVVVPLDAEGNVHVVRQYRHATDGWLLELPAGKLDPGEAPAQCAAREVEEEVGHRARELVELGFIWPAPGLMDEKIFVFLARGLEPTEQALEADEVLEVEKLPFGVLYERALSGDLVDAKSICALVRVRHWLDVGEGRTRGPRRRP